MEAALASSWDGVVATRRAGLLNAWAMKNADCRDDGRDMACDEAGLPHLPLGANQPHLGGSA